MNSISYNLTCATLCAILPKEYVEASHSFEFRPNEPDTSYTRYCEKHNLPIGTEVPPLSRYTVYFIGFLNAVITPLGLLVCTVESVARTIFSVPLFGLNVLRQAPLLRSIVPLKAANFIQAGYKAVGDPVNNLVDIARYSVLFLFTLFSAPSNFCRYETDTIIPADYNQYVKGRLF